MHGLRLLLTVTRRPGDRIAIEDPGYLNAVVAARDHQLEIVDVPGGRGRTAGVRADRRTRRLCHAVAPVPARRPAIRCPTQRTDPVGAPDRGDADRGRLRQRVPVRRRAAARTRPTGPGSRRPPRHAVEDPQPGAPPRLAGRVRTDSSTAWPPSAPSPATGPAGRCRPPSWPCSATAISTRPSAAAATCTPNAVPTPAPCSPRTAKSSARTPASTSRSCYPTTIDDLQLAAAARQAGVVVAPLSEYRRTTPGPPGLVIGYATPSTSDLHKALTTLTQVLDHFTAHRSPG